MTAVVAIVGDDNKVRKEDALGMVLTSFFLFPVN